MPIQLIAPKDRSWPEDLDHLAKLDMQGKLQHRAAPAKPSLREVVAEAQRSGVIVTAKPAKPRQEVTRLMIDESNRRIMDAERRAKQAETRAVEAETYINDLDAKVRMLQVRLETVSRAAGARDVWSRPCCLCGARGWCDHREPELAEGPPPLRAHDVMCPDCRGKA